MCSYQQTSSSVVFLKTLVNKLNIFSGVDISSAEGYISCLVSTAAFISDCISFAAVSITLKICVSGSSGLGKLYNF